MRTRPLGPSSLRVSVVGLGCNNFGRRIDESAARLVVDAALDAGINFFDTADIYGGGASERFLGAAVSGRREHALIATKWGGGSPDEHGRPLGSPEVIREALDASLRRLGTDYIDLYQYHRPDGVTPIDETLGTLDELVREGKIRAAGASNLNADGIIGANAASIDLDLVRLVSHQNEYSLINRDVEADILPACEAVGAGFLPYFPLASGILTGKYRRDEKPADGTRLAAWGLHVSEEQWDRAERVIAFAHERGLDPLQVAIGGLAAMPAVSSVIAGATTPEQVRANAAAGSWMPSLEELTALKAPR